MSARDRQSRPADERFDAVVLGAGPAGEVATGILAGPGCE